MLRQWEDFIIFQDYILLKQIATGGMAKVYLARKKGAHGFEKIYAIKQLHDHLRENESFFSMFLQEAKLSSKLDHPNIVKIFDLLGEGDHFFMVMEFIRGKNLRDILKKASQGKLNIRNLALKITAEILKGLWFAHNLKDMSGRPLDIIHRDISPQNIMISYEGEIKITDFGIAKAADNFEETRTGVLKGKISYMSPEQAHGKVLDCRSDIFSVGIMLYEMLFLRKCFSGTNSIEVLSKVRAGDYTPIDSIAPDLDPKLKAILQKALAYSPEKRYQSARDFHKDIEDYLYEKRFSQDELNVSRFMQENFCEEIKREFEELSGLNRRAQKIPYISSSEEIPAKSAAAGNEETRTRHSSRRKKFNVLSFLLNLLLMLLIPFLLFDVFFYSYYTDFMNGLKIPPKLTSALLYRPAFLPVIDLIPYFSSREVEVVQPSRNIKMVFNINKDPFEVTDADNRKYEHIREAEGIYSMDIRSHKNYKFIFSKPGYADFPLDVNLNKTNTIPFTVTMTEKSSSVAFVIEPDDSLLYIDGEFKSNSSPYILSYNPEFETRTHSIKIVKEGYEGLESTFHFSGDTKTFRIKLERKMVNIQFKVLPWGYIYNVDGSLIGECEKDGVVIRKLPAGKHTFKFVYPDSDAEKTLSYNLLESQTVTVNFSEAFGTVSITSYPYDAAIYINEVIKGQTPLTLMLKSGYYKIVISKEKYRYCTREITVQGGKSYEVNCTLEIDE